MGGGGGWGAKGGVKHQFGLKEQCFAFSMQHKLLQSTKGGQDYREEQFGASCSPINMPQDHEMHPCGFTALVKSLL